VPRLSPASGAPQDGSTRGQEVGASITIASIAQRSSIVLPRIATRSSL
jgi:hypothetical protein